MATGKDASGDPLTTLVPTMRLSTEMTVFDTVYMPEETPLLKRAIEHGCKVITGSEMFRKQAAAQQQFWATESAS